MERITKYTVYKRRYTTLYDLPPVHAKRQVKFFLYKGKKDLTTRHLSQKYMQYGYIRNNTKSNRSGAHTEHNAQRSTRAHRGVRSRRSQNSVRVSVFYRLQVSFVISRSSRGVKHVLLLPLCFDFFLYCDIKITRAVRDASRRGRGSASPRGPSDRRPARQTVKVWVALIGAASPSGQRCALGEGERVLHKPRAGRDALSPRVGKQRLSAQSRRIGDALAGAHHSLPSGA
jgi:hypothetical protein